MKGMLHSMPNFILYNHSPIGQKGAFAMMLINNNILRESTWNAIQNAKKVLLMDGDKTILDKDNIKITPVLIPMAYAREETDEAPDIADIPNIPHYELYIVRQVETIEDYKPAIVLWKLPKTGIFVTIKAMVTPGRIGIEKREHTAIIRGSDELDRRIVYGFCHNNWSDIRIESFETKGFWTNIDSDGYRYRASDAPKRIKLYSDEDDIPYINSHKELMRRMREKSDYNRYNESCRILNIAIV